MVPIYYYDDGRTRKKHSIKIRYIAYNVDHCGQSLYPKYISAWNGLAEKTAEANTSDLFKSKLAHYALRRAISNHIRERILLIPEPEPEQNQNKY